MSDFVWILWVVLGVILIVAEIFTSGFVLLWFGAGAIAAALAALAGAGYPFQFLIFFLVSIALTAASRTIFTKYLMPEAEEGGYKSGAESLPGQVGTVVAASQGALLEGAVKVYGTTWTAYPAEGEEPLEAGARVVVERVRGASIYVRRAPSAPDWRPSALPPGREE
ncbi:MAG TPA: NfeD family protein [Pyrinomonadaceae bacterium]|nr:NfeD family protein [Pyrinomonadaceae bacterium]